MTGPETPGSSCEKRGDPGFPGNYTAILQLKTLLEVELPGLFLEEGTL